MSDTNKKDGKEMSDSNLVQFCDACREWVECDCEIDINTELIHEMTAHLIATRSLVCLECGNTLKIQTDKHYIDLDWKD